MAITAEMTRTEQLNVRMTSDQARLISRAARAIKADPTSFVVESACICAEEALASEQHPNHAAKQSVAFTAAMDRPAHSKSRLRALLRRPSILERK